MSVLHLTFPEISLKVHILQNLRELFHEGDLQSAPTDTLVLCIVLKRALANW